MIVRATKIFAFTALTAVITLSLLGMTYQYILLSKFEINILNHLDKSDLLMLSVQTFNIELHNLQNINNIDFYKKITYIAFIFFICKYYDITDLFLLRYQ